MEDEQFIAHINKIAADNKFRLPVIDESPPSEKAISAWAEFLKICMKHGIKLSDPRWERVTIGKHRPVTVFELQGVSSEPPDTDFRVGLQLLMGMLEQDPKP